MGPWCPNVWASLGQSDSSASLRATIGSQTMKNFAIWVLASLVTRMPNGILKDQRFFDLCQRKGLHILPVHFYHPIPNTAELPDALWETPSEMVGVEMNIEQQRELLEEISQSYLQEYFQLLKAPAGSPGAYAGGQNFSGLDGAMLYSIIRKFKPRKIIEIGSGYSTLLSIMALEKNASQDPKSGGKLLAIEPFPPDFIKDGLGGPVELRVEKVENVPLSVFEELGEGDILFVDSSHTVKIGGDVVYEILEIVPRLNRGVLIHFHDIFLPLQYPKAWVRGRRVFWNEQYLLHAFLAFNHDFEILWSAGCMHSRQPAALERYFPDYDRNQQEAGSIWMRRCS